MQKTAQKTVQDPQPPLSDTRHLADLKFVERPLIASAHSQQMAAGSMPTEGLQTDMVMLQKADVWMHQFKTRLNMGIMALVMLWGAVSYLKSTKMELAAHDTTDAAPILADGSGEDEARIMEVSAPTPAAATVETVQTEGTGSRLPISTAKAAPEPQKKPVASKRNAKKIKKSIASKSK